MTDRPYGEMVSAREAQRRLGIPAPTVHTWAQRCATTGLYAAGRDRRGNLYFEADLLVLRGRLAIWDGEHRVHTLASIVRLATGLVDQPGSVELSMSLQSRARRRNAA